MLRKEVKAKPFSISFDEQVNICRKMYGEQLKFQENLDLSPDVAYDILTKYGDTIYNRITNTIEFSKNIYTDMIQDIDKQIDL